MTPRTAAAVSRAQRAAVSIRRWGSAVVALAGALGITGAQVIEAGGWSWLKDLGPIPSVLLVGLGLMLVHLRLQREDERASREAIERRCDQQVEMLERHMEQRVAEWQDALTHVMSGAAETARQVEKLVGVVQEVVRKVDEISAAHFVRKPPPPPVPR